MIYTEGALEQLRNVFDNNGLKYELGSITEKLAELTVIKNNITVRVWFDADKQLFGFDMIQGGCKTYPKIEEFMNMFNTYLTIHTDFLPKAKIVADTFEKSLDISTVYDNFFGNSKDGYSALFRVLGASNVVTVTKVANTFIARYGHNSEDGKTFNTVSEYHYEVDEVGNISTIPTVHSYLEELSKRYKDDDTVEIERIGVDEFNFSIEDICIHAKIEFMYKNIIYNVLDISGEPIELLFTLKDDPYSLSALYLQCKSPYDDYMECKQNSDKDEKSRDDLKSVTEEIIDNDKITYKEQYTSKSNSNEIIKKEIEVQEGINDSKEKVIEDIKSDITKESYEKDDNFSLKVVKNTDNVISIVQFIVDDDIYTISLEKAISIGVPVNRIEDSVSYVKKHGITMTEDELRLKKFSKDVSDDNEICEELYNMIFD